LGIKGVCDSGVKGEGSPRLRVKRENRDNKKKPSFSPQRVADPRRKGRKERPGRRNQKQETEYFTTEHTEKHGEKTGTTKRATRNRDFTTGGTGNHGEKACAENRESKVEIG